MTQEEVRVAIGVDNSSLKRGLFSAESQIKSSFARSTSSIKNAMNSLKGGLLAGGLLNIFSIGEGIGAKMDEFKTKAAGLGAWWGAFSVGGIKMAMEMEGSLARAIQLGDAAKKANQERWVEETKLADAIKRRKEAEAEVSQVNETAAQKLKRLQKEHFDILERLHNTKKEDSKTEEIRIELAKKLKEVVEQQKDVDKEKADAKKKADEDELRRGDKLKDQAKELSNARGAASDSRKSRLESFMPSIAELAEFGWRDAKDVQFLENDARLAFKKGNVDFAKGRIDQADNLRLGLQNRGILAEDPSLKAQRESAATLAKLEKEGIKVKGAD